jgi:protocatechuate 3,4-dioxygenase beta subunit
MRADDEAAFEAFVAARSNDLLRTAPYERVRLTVRVLDGGGNVVAETTVEQQG